MTAAAGDSGDLKEVGLLVGILKGKDPEAIRRLLIASFAMSGLDWHTFQPANRQFGTDAENAHAPGGGRGPNSVNHDIRSLKAAKQPKTKNEMAALVAYYLSEIAPEKRKAIGAKDIAEYFKQAQFDLPGDATSTLFNAAAAGLMKKAGNGLFELTPVGYNLVVADFAKTPKGPKPKRSTKARAAKSSKR